MAAMANTTYEEISAANGNVELFIRSWRPERPSGVVVIVPGFNAHSGYYGWAGEQFVAAGLAVYAVDLRGRGKSAGERFYVDSFDEYVGDAGACVDIAADRHPGLPMVLLGHSAGGVVACLYALDHQDRLAGLVCESFAFETPAPELALAALKGLAHVAPHLHVLHLKNEDFTRDPAAVARMNGDPLIAHETQPAETVAALIRADEHLKQSFARITLPVLILHGTADKAAKAEGSQFFFDHAGSTDKTLKLYDGHVHDLLNDTGRERVAADITAWIAGRAAARQEHGR
jgi:alpha-beta hydrolase superfamily lysophospholipase